MAVQVTVYVQSCVWGNSRWDAEDGGSLMFTYSHGGTPIRHRTSDDFYPRNVIVVDGSLDCSLRIADAKETFLPGDAVYDITVVLTKPSTQTLVLRTMKMHDIRMTGNRAIPHEAELFWTHESADGQTNPIS